MALSIHILKPVNKTNLILTYIQNKINNLSNT